LRPAIFIISFDAAKQVKSISRTQTARITSLCHYTAKRLPETSGSFHLWAQAIKINPSSL
jgi:hypothetical protein